MGILSSLFSDKKETISEIDTLRNDLNARMHLDSLDLKLLKHHIETTNKSGKHTITHGQYQATVQFTGNGILIENII